MDPLYSVGTWDADAQAFTPQAGLSVSSMNVTIPILRQALRELREMGYSAHRRRNDDGTHDDNDPWVLVERTDGKPEQQILDEWRR